jgi:hypothetical protein
MLYQNPFYSAMVNAELISYRVFWPLLDIMITENCGFEVVWYGHFALLSDAHSPDHLAKPQAEKIHHSACHSRGNTAYSLPLLLE